MEMMPIMLLALVLDLAFGEPPNSVHPVAWMGKVALYLKRIYGGHSTVGQFIHGAGIVLFTIAAFTVPTYFLLIYLEDLNPVIHIVVGGVLLKFTFSLRGLQQAAIRVKKLLIEDKLNEARLELRALVSRDTQNLSQALLVSATVESVAENLNDSFVAPLFYYLIFGVLGAITYRVVNTLDAMIGYHGEYEYLGKFTSRLDDVLNFIPARLTALLLVLAAFISRQNGRKSWQVVLRDHTKTESPNAGWPMAAVAGALDIQLKKPESYKLGNMNVPLVPQIINDSLKMVQIAMMMWFLVCFITGGIQFAIRA
ncbi:cobalamin biosynthesis protein [Chloroflexota bacterium]